MDTLKVVVLWVLTRAEAFLGTLIVRLGDGAKAPLKRPEGDRCWVCDGDCQPSAHAVLTWIESAEDFDLYAHDNPHEYAEIEDEPCPCDWVQCSICESHDQVAAGEHGPYLCGECHADLTMPAGFYLPEPSEVAVQQLIDQANRLADDRQLDSSMN